MELTLGVLTALAPLSIDMYLPAMPTIGDKLHVSSASVQLTLTTFFVGFATGQFLSGPLLDRFGRRAPLFVALAVYIAGSLGCALAPTNGWLMIFRALQALGGATAVVVPRAVVRDLATGSEAARMLSRLLLVMGVAPIVAPLLGGALLAWFGWRAIFVLLALFGAFAMIISARVVPRGEPRPQAWLGSLAALVTEKDFMRFTFAGGAAQSGMFAYITGSAFVLITLFHVSPRAFGFFFGANAFGLIFASQVNRRLLQHRSPLAVVHVGTMFLLAGGALVLFVAITGTFGLWGTAAAFFLFVASIGLVTPNTVALSLESHGARAGVASAVMGAMQFGMAAAASSAVSAFYDGTARPLGFTMATLACLTFVAVRAGSKGASAAIKPPAR